MNQRKIHAYQLIDGKQFNKYVERNHLFSAFADDPVYSMETVQRLWDVNLGEDFASMVEKQGVEYIPEAADGRFEWKLMYIESHYECLGAWRDADGVTAIAAGEKVGANQTTWYMDFQGDPFSATELITGSNPNADRVYVHEDGFNVGGDVFRYKVGHSYARDVEDFFDSDIILPGTMWSAEAGLVSKYWSDRGVDISFRTPARAYGEMSSFRVQHRVAGHLLAGYRPKYFYVPDPNKPGKLMDQPLWISNVEYEFLKKIRQVRAYLLMYGKSNRKSDGSYSIVDSRSGYEISAGSGWHEQMLASNINVYAGLPNLDEVEGIIQALVVGKVSLANRNVIIKAGEYGIAELSRMVVRAYGSGSYQANPWLEDTTGRAIFWSGNEVTINFGQVMGVALMNGIKVKFVLDPSKDDPTRNKIPMGNGLNGFASSYQYDIIVTAMGNEGNFRIVRRQNEMPVFGVIEGMRGMISRATSFSNPKQLSSALDGMTIHYQEHGVGAKVADPTKVIRYYPAILPD